MNEGSYLQNQPLDPSLAFERPDAHFFVADKLDGWDAESGAGFLTWKRMALKQRVSYHQVTHFLDDYSVWADAPPHEYHDDQTMPMAVSFVTPRTVRLRMALRPVSFDESLSPMLQSLPTDDSWRCSETENRILYQSSYGSLVIGRDPWAVEVRDAQDKVLTRTNHLSDSVSVVNTHPLPFCGLRTPDDLNRRMAASFRLAPTEHLYGCGESFSRLDKRGQKLLLWTSDAYSTQTPRMYKPVPFFLSNRGYGMFAHSSAPMAFDLGHSFDTAAVLFVDDDVLDLFLFLGSPQEVVSEYTALTGRSTVPPAWSFGLWMGRDSYKSQQEVLDTAGKLRAQRIPCDVIHIDTHWSEVPFRADFKFSSTRFPDPKSLTAELGRLGLKLSLWQFPYLHPNDELHAEAVERGYVVLSRRGKPPVDDAVLDLTNPDAVRWYQEKLTALLDQGVAVFTSDFGEAAPQTGIYQGDRSSFQEHNLYPLRYNRAVAEVMNEVAGYSLQFARAAWAGSQRYPLHFGGDAEVSDGGMAGTLRGGLSLGLCGFTFWSHFIGGFPESPPVDLYRRWLGFGVLCSHARCHGAPPREPWEFGQDFVDYFRRAVELRYELMPYIYTQARVAASLGHPMIRPLFFDHPKDRTSWLIEDQYCLGSDLLVAPLFEPRSARDVYLPSGGWFDYQSGTRYEGAGWRAIEAGPVEVVLLAREGAVLPCASVAGCVDDIDWSRLKLKAFGGAGRTSIPIALPEEDEIKQVVVELGNSPSIVDDPFGGRVRWSPTSV